MDIIEENYRNRPRNPIAIRHYVASLLDAGRVLEASFFFESLMAEDPVSIDTNILGYRLAIKRMDHNVANFDKHLHMANASQEDIYSLQLAYYLSFGANVHLVQCAKALIDTEIKSHENMTILIEAIESTGSYDLASKFVTYHYGRVKPTNYLDMVLKKILATKLIEIIRGNSER